MIVGGHGDSRVERSSYQRGPRGSSRCHVALLHTNNARRLHAGVRSGRAIRRTHEGLCMSAGLGRMSAVADGGDLRGACQVSAIVVNFNGGSDLLTCLAALCSQMPRANIIVVDNASTDGSVERVSAQFRDVRVLASTANLGFGGGANLGACEAFGDTLLFLNPDTFVMPGCVDELDRALANGAGVVGPRLRVGEEEVPEYGATIDVMGMPRGLATTGEPLYVSGCCLATSRRCFDAVGGFDERYFLFVEDVEFCWQALRRGYDVRVAPRAEARHRGGGSMPGGYARNGTVEVSAARIVLRERNTTALFLACAPVQWLPLVGGASLLRATAFAGLLASRGRWLSIWELVMGLGQNVVWIPGTMRRRWRPGVARPSARRAWARVEWGLFLWDFLHARQAISFVDAGGGPRPVRAEVDDTSDSIGL